MGWPLVTSSQPYVYNKTFVVEDVLPFSLQIHVALQYRFYQAIDNNKATVLIVTGALTDEYSYFFTGNKFASMVFLGNNLFYTDVSESQKISSCVLLHVFFSHILPGPLHASNVVYVFELLIYAKRLERACPKGHDPCSGVSTLIVCRHASDSRRDTVIRPTGINHVCLPFTAVSFNDPSACISREKRCQVDTFPLHFTAISWPYVGM